MNACNSEEVLCTSEQPCKSYTNCNCTPCTPPIFPSVDTNSTALTPVLSNKIIDCITLSNKDVGVNNEYSFTLDNTNFNYANGDPVCIEYIGISYDYIGLPQLSVTSSQSYIDGQIFTLNPNNLFNAGTVESPIFLFNDLSGYVSLDNHVCCNIPCDKPRLVRIVESGKSFEVNNLIITAQGYIGCTPFTATSTISDSINEDSLIVTLSSLGILSSTTFDGLICWPDIKRKYIVNDSFNTSLQVDCIRPSSNFIPASITGLGSGSFLGIVDFSFCVSETISLISREGVPILTNRNINICENNISFSENNIS